VQLHSAEDLATLRRRCKASLDAHRRRAAADHQELNYTAADLQALVTAADVVHCAYCGGLLDVPDWVFDHAVPPCRSGTYRLANLRLACRSCNESKGLLTADEFRELLQLLSGWHPRARADLLARLKAGGRRRAGR
jgi:5-methylcytosine-specific restriction endonuclease McrA